MPFKDAHGRKRRQRGAVVQEQAVLTRADEQAALVVAQQDGERLVAERRRTGERPQRVALENVQPRLRGDHVDAAIHQRRATETRGRLDDRHLLVCPHEDGARGLDDDAILGREESPHVGEGRRIAWQPISHADVFEAAAGIWSEVAEAAHGPDPDAIVVVDCQRPNRAGVVAYLNPAPGHAVELQHGGVRTEVQDPAPVLDDAPRLRAAADLERLIRADEGAPFLEFSGARQHLSACGPGA